MYNSKASNGDLPFAELKAIAGELEQIEVQIAGLKARIDTILLAHEGSQIAPRIEALRLGATAASASVAGASASAIEDGATNNADLQQGQMADEPLASAALAQEAASDHQHWDISHKDEDAGFAGDGVVPTGCDLGAQVVADFDDAPAIADAAETASEMSATELEDACERALASDASCSEQVESDPLEIQFVGQSPSGDDVAADAQGDDLAPETATLDADTVAVAAACAEIGDDQHASDCAAIAEVNDLDAEEPVLALALPIDPAAGDEHNAELLDEPAMMLDGGTEEQPSTLPDVAIECDLTNSEILISADMGPDAFDEADAPDEAAASTAEEPLTLAQSPADENSAAATEADDEQLKASEPQDEAAASCAQGSSASDPGEAPPEGRTRKERRSRYTTIATAFTLAGAACVATVTGVLLVRPELMLHSLKLMIG